MSRAGAPWLRLSLKRRVALLLLATVALFTVLQGALAVFSMHEQEDELVEQITLAEARRLAERLARSGPQLLSPEDPLILAEHFSAWWVGADGASLPGPLPQRLASLGQGPHRLGGLYSDQHVVVLPVPDGRLYVLYDAEVNEAKVRDFALYIVTLGAVVMALALVLARHLAGAVLAPIERVTRQLERWVPAAPQAGGAARPDEETRLLDAFGRVQARLEQELADEREFIANLRHELRTPLAAARTDLEMLALDTGDAAARRQRLQRAMAALDAAGSALSAVPLPGARRGGATPEPVALARCVQDAWDSLGELPAQAGLLLRNEVAPGVRVLADRHALLTLLRNLMRNAAEHAAPAHCRVACEAGCLLVEDNGPGVPDDELPFVFERYWRGRLRDAPFPAEAAVAAEPRGLGLAIARQMAENQGWQLESRAVAPHGLCFVLRPQAGQAFLLPQDGGN